MALSESRALPRRLARPPFAVLTTAQDLIRHRSLVWALLVRQLKVRYRGSVLGFVWTFLNPLLLMAVYALVFRFYMRIAVPNYALFLLAGLLPWQWFASSLNEGTNAVVGGSSLVTKSLFPTEILPTVVVLANMVNFLLSIPLLWIAGWIYGIAPSPLPWLSLLPVIVLQFAFTLGLVLALAALNVHYRDVQHIVSNLLLLWFFLTPIVYPESQVPEAMRPLLLLNPMALFIHGYHDVLVQSSWPSLEILGALTLYALIALLVGAKIYDAYRDTFPELV
ncbi:MAG TPA: ABC transporter permease [Candidatus Binatia bacterium]|nr:ABC transporter permease [Candidatus Binatia bacterium]